MSGTTLAASSCGLASCASRTHDAAVSRFLGSVRSISERLRAVGDARNLLIYIDNPTIFSENIGKHSYAFQDSLKIVRL